MTKRSQWDNKLNAFTVELYCFRSADDSNMEEDADIDALGGLKSKAIRTGLAVLSDFDGDVLYIGCMPDDKEKYGLVDLIFEEFKKIPGTNILQHKPVVMKATYDDICPSYNI